MYRIDRGVSPKNEKLIGSAEWLLLAVLIGLAGFSIVVLAWQSIIPRPIRFSGMVLDRLSASLTLLVASIGAATYRFSLRYLDGESRQRRFLRYLAFTVVMAYLLMISSNLLLLLAAWSLTSFGLHRLLTYYPDRFEARRSARKKFLISRVGDLALVAAIVVIWRTWSTLDLHEFLRRVGGSEDTAAAHLVGLLVVLAALTKSAQFPFHSWLPETMESPTPVSALMHAGIINAGGALLIRFSPLLVRHPGALFLLVVVGTLTASLGMLAMWAQAKVKRTLAWSTVSQMGFMMVQCGLGIFPAAALHIVGHGCYKAWSFLRSGDLPKPMPNLVPPSPTRTISLIVIGATLSIPALGMASVLTGFTPWHSPGELALCAIVALSIGQLWVVLLGVGSSTVPIFVKRSIGALSATLAVSVAAAGLYRGVSLFLIPVLGDLPAPASPLAWVSAWLTVIAFSALTVVHAFLPIIGRSASGRAFHVHALHGFYFGAVADRVVGEIWGHFESKQVNHG